MVPANHRGRSTASRRRFLGAVGATALATTAGCLDTLSGSDDGDSTNATDSAGAQTTGDGDSAESASGSQTLAGRIDRAAISLETTDPSAPLDDVAPLGDRLAEHSIVGLGEATHGTREFFRLKHRFLRYLIEEHGLRVLGIETGFAQAMALDEYVTGAEGDPESGMDGFYSIWHSDAVLAFVEWLRTFNDGRPADDQVRCYGFDMQVVTGPASRVRSFLQAVDPEYLETIGDDLSVLAEEGMVTTGNDDGARMDRLELLRSTAGELTDRFDAEESTYAQAESDQRWPVVRRCVRVLEQAAAFYHQRIDPETASNAGLRDQYMAENVAWLHDHVGEEPIALWAHNAHVKRGMYQKIGSEAMGQYLADEYGDDYYVLGFEFGHGGFRAVGADSGELQSWEIEPPDDALAAELAAVDDDLYVLEAEAARDDDRLWEWLSDRHRIHSIGAGFGEDLPEEAYYGTYPIAEDFDAICYVDETTAARESE